MLIHHLWNSELVGNYSILTTGTDPSGSADTTYTPNGYTLINTNPYYFVLSGYVNGSRLYYFTGRAYYWSSTAVSRSQAYTLGFSSGGVWPADRFNRDYGWSLRCVAICVQIKY
ncbi:hypothetical protein IKF86_01655 [Candidatus Saccharibacteria bacterium]|nr:hypothetical protein [Candidatus Saccharibacteria bacterium]